MEIALEELEATTKEVFLSHGQPYALKFQGLDGKCPVLPCTGMSKRLSCPRNYQISAHRVPKFTRRHQ